MAKVATRVAMKSPATLDDLGPGVEEVVVGLKVVCGVTAKGWLEVPAGSVSPGGPLVTAPTAVVG